jgi:hypothetical protein
MREIVASEEYYPSVFQVILQSSDHTEGFDATAEFRNEHGPYIGSVTCHDDTAEGAILELKTQLDMHFQISDAQKKVIGKP